MQKVFRVIYTVLICQALISFSALAQKKDFVLVEAESFNEKGGWVLDQQFMDQMGSPFLLAHGIGKPVQDASTKVMIPKKGIWHVYVRTWNWCSPWKTKEAPGRFKVAVNGVVLDNELGMGKQWDWEYAGSIEIKDKSNIVTLKDLTGFEGRCDAILFAKDKNVVIHNRKEDLPAFRKQLLNIPAKPEDGGHYDLVVVGAGTAGLSAAIKGAREGLKVALINNRPVPGGNNSTEIRVVASGEMNVKPYTALGSVVREIRNVYSQEDQVIEMIQAEKTLSYFPNMHVFAASKEGKQIKSVTAKHIENGKEIEFFSPLFVDCSGDGNLGYLAGAEYRVGREMRQETRETLAPDRPDNIVLGATISWKSKVMPAEVSFPVCEWAIQFNDESCEKVVSGSNWWESGFRYDQVNDAEYIRDYLFRAIYGNWAFLKNDSKFKKEYANRELDMMTYIAGKRESRRLVGDVFFVQQDIEKEYVKYDDAVVIGTYSIDQHFPTPKNTFFFPGEEFISTMKHYFNDLGTPRRYLRDDQVPPPYRIPYRCLYSVNVDNLFMAGRNISVSHIALSSTRVQNTTGMMGEVVAAAAALCKKYNCLPREVYTKHLDELLDSLK
ncbi:FAD-dependent oxidoreductase [uncultured Parabacteroides sp.]|uniref:FAD-dependent oxidoreductase n=1 Tax=uncultured Parabacteroides sp. TaxID=512312 RepID=UPI0026E58E71|nr:FAD-dependent oxidoreductase [uncultured Parabacteroides sp.]